MRQRTSREEEVLEISPANITPLVARGRFAEFLQERRDGLFVFEPPRLREGNSGHRHREADRRIVEYGHDDLGKDRGLWGPRPEQFTPTTIFIP